MSCVFQVEKKKLCIPGQKRLYILWRRKTLLILGRKKETVYSRMRKVVYSMAEKSCVFYRYGGKKRLCILGQNKRSVVF